MTIMPSLRLASPPHSASVAFDNSIAVPATPSKRGSSPSRSATNSPLRSQRIGLLIDSLIGGGAERVVLNLAQAFERLGHEVHIILLRNDVHHSLPAGIKLHSVSETGQLSACKPLNKLLLAWRLNQLVRTVESDGRRFDFFISNAEDSDRVSRIAGLERVYIRYRNSMVEYLYNKIGNKTGLKRVIRSLRWHRRFRSIYSKRPIITVSKALQQEIVEAMGVRPTSITTIYNPFDFSSIRAQGEAFVPHVDGPYIVCAAKLERRKRQDVLLRAFAQSAARHTHKLVLLGGTYTESDRAWHQELLQLIDELGLTQQVLLPGFQQNPFPWVRHADLFVLASDSEGLPTVVIESLILGTPVVSTDCPTGPREILTGDLAEFLCPRNDPVAMQMRIDRALVCYPRISEAHLTRFSADYSARQYLRHCAASA